MTTTYFQFTNRSDEIEGVALFASRSRIDAFRGGIYSVRSEELRWLDDAGLGYRLATDAEIEEARQGVLTLHKAHAR